MKNPKMITCKLTGTIGHPVRSHIIPESFYLIPPQAEGPLKIVSNVQGLRPKTSRTGVYDEGIVTAEGEEYFRKSDDYAYKLLVEQFPSSIPLDDGTGPKAYAYTTYDYTMLKLFVLSVLWRASVSTQPMFRKVELGPHEEVVRQIILSGNVGSPDQYSTALAIFDDNKRYAKIMDPFPEKYDGITYYRLYIGNIIGYVKVDQRAPPKMFSHVHLRPDAPLILIQRKFEGSREHGIRKAVVRHVHSRYPNLFGQARLRSGDNG